MKVEANSFEEFFAAAGKWEEPLRALDKLIVAELPDLKRELFSGMSITMIAYGVQPYKTKSGLEGEWPLIAIAPQKNYASLYACVCKNGQYLAEKYAKDLGKASCGKSCIRFKKLEDLNLETVKKMLREVSN